MRYSDHTVIGIPHLPDMYKIIRNRQIALRNHIKIPQDLKILVPSASPKRCSNYNHTSPVVAENKTLCPISFVTELINQDMTIL